MANIAIILYLGFPVGIFSQFEKQGHLKITICKKKTYFKLPMNHQADFNEIYVRCSSKTATASGWLSGKPMIR